MSAFAEGFSDALHRSLAVRWFARWMIAMQETLGWPRWSRAEWRFWLNLAAGSRGKRG